MEFVYENKKVEDFLKSSGIEIIKGKSGINSLFLKDVYGNELNLIAELGIEQIPSIFTD